MFFGVDYYPEQWVFPYGGTADDPEGAWERDAELMVKAGINVVRIGEFSWGLCEPEGGQIRFPLAAPRDGHHGAATTSRSCSAPPPPPRPSGWRANIPKFCRSDEHGLVKHEGTRRAVCFNNDTFWNASKRLVENMARALGDHPQLIAWQIDSGIGGHQTEWSFNEDSRLEWQNWLKLKYETVERLNDRLGLRYWAQVVSSFDEVPMPMYAPGTHNPALLLDWNRFCSDAIIAFVRMQADVLHELCPDHPVTVNLRALQRKFDHFDMADVVDFVSVESNAAIKAKSAELACDIDILRSLKKQDIRTPDGDCGFWVIEQKAGQVNWQDVNSLVRPGVIRLFTYQLISRGACGVLYYHWRQPRIGNEKFFGAVLPHHLEGNTRVYQGNQPDRRGTQVARARHQGHARSCRRPASFTPTTTTGRCNSRCSRPNSSTCASTSSSIYNALHDRNIRVDFARPTEDLVAIQARLRAVAALAGRRRGRPAQTLRPKRRHARQHVQHRPGGRNISIAPDTGYPNDLTDLFGMEVLEFDPIPPGEENHLTFKGAFQTSHLHPARLWCDIIEPKGCQILATYAKDFYAGRPAITMNNFGLGKAIYIGTMSHQHFYHDFIVWLRQMCGLQPLLKVPENVEVSMREKEGTRVYFLLNHQNSPVRIQFYKPMHDYLTGNTFSGNYDLPPHGVLVLDEHPEAKTVWRPRLILIFRGEFLPTPFSPPWRC